MPEVAVEVKPASRRHIILFALGMLCYWAAMYVYVPIFSVYAESLGASLSVVGLGVGMYGLTQLLTRVPIGIWSDAMGKRRGIVVVGMLVCGVAAAGLALSPLGGLAGRVPRGDGVGGRDLGLFDGPLCQLLPGHRSVGAPEHHEPADRPGADRGNHRRAASWQSTSAGRCPSGPRWF